MKVNLWLKNNKLVEAELTTERAESSYGVPVLVVDGEVYTPLDAALANASFAGQPTDDVKEALSKGGYVIQEEPWGFKLRRLRTAAGMTQEALASQLGVSQSQISQFERKKNPPKSNILEKLKTIFPEI